LAAQPFFRHLSGIGGMPASATQRGLKMRAELDARACIAHHDNFSTDLEAGARARVRRLAAIDFGKAPAARLAAAVLASSLTLATLGFTIVE